MSPSPEASDASHESDHDEQSLNNAKAHANTVKDKGCPYCHQKFTSSSLGRHLDQYISKKKPDGLHNVEEIKRLRAGITRRSAKVSRKSVEEQSRKSRTTSPSQVHSSTNISGITNSTTPIFHPPAWTAAGVLTEPSVVDTHKPTASATTVPLFPQQTAQVGTKRSFSTYAADLTPGSSSETARALELSLREVLDTINAALKTAEPAPLPFEFDFRAQTFPSLCILLLPAPATLWQVEPFQTSATIPLTIPGIEQLHALRNKVPEIIDQWKWTALAHVQKTGPGSINIGEEAGRLSLSAQKYINDALAHLDTAFQFWMNHNSSQQQYLWNLELLRAYNREKAKSTKAEEQTKHLTEEITRLQQQVDYLGRCQWPREMALWPPERVALKTSVQKELGMAQVSSLGALYDSASQTQINEKWDFDKLVNKWKRHVREDRARRGQVPTLDHQDSEASGGSPVNNKQRWSERAANGSISHVHSPAHVQQARAPSMAAYAGRGQHGSLKVPASTPAAQSVQSSSSRTQTPVQGIQIVSDIGDTFARFAPYLRQRDLEEKSGT